MVPGSGSDLNSPLPALETGREITPFSWASPRTAWSIRMGTTATPRCRPGQTYNSQTLPLGRGHGTSRCPVLEHPPALAGCWHHHPSRLFCETAAARLEGLGRKGLPQAPGEQGEAWQGAAAGCFKKDILKAPI